MQIMRKKKMSNYISRAYYSFEDLVIMAQGNAKPYSQLNILYILGIGVEFAGVAQQVFGDAKTQTLINKYIYPKYCEETIAWYDLEPCSTPIEVRENATEEELEFLFKSFTIQFARILVETFEKYSKLIELQNSIKNKLLDKVESETEVKNRFNDTPQNASPDFWNDDEHATNINVQTQTNKAELATPIQRLAEVEQNIKDYYTMWAYEFSELFKAGE